VTLSGSPLLRFIHTEIAFRHANGYHTGLSTHGGENRSTGVYELAKG
jgi:hypothetical protein